MSNAFPALPYPEFPLRRHSNGHWFKSVWNPRTKKSEQFYFGASADDPKGEQALHHPVSGWLARRSAIMNGTDNVRIVATPDVITLGELMARFLTFKRNQVRAGDRSARTLGDYLYEVEKFVAFLKPGTPVASLRPEHFSSYVQHLVETRKLGRHSRRRVRAYLNCFLRYGVLNGWCPTPSTGTDWAAPATDPNSIRMAKLRAGKKDYSDRILSGEELDKLLARASVQFKAMILVGVNCGLGPADIGRLHWSAINMDTGRLTFPRQKTGVMRTGYLWKKTRAALLAVRKLKHNRKAIERDGDSALVFVTRCGQPFYREREVHQEVDVDGRKVKKLVGVAADYAISTTFGRMARELKLEGVHFYRLRHTFKTLAKKAKDKDAIDAMMGHVSAGVAAVYDHEVIAFSRIKRTARVVYRRLWPKTKQTEGKPTTKTTANAAAGGAASCAE